MAPVATATTSAASTAPTATSGSAAGGTATAPVAAAPTATTIVSGQRGRIAPNQRCGGDLPGADLHQVVPEYSNVDKDVRFNYQPIGSGAGIQQIQNQTVDFGGSDAPHDRRTVAAGKGRRAIPYPDRVGRCGGQYTTCRAHRRG